MCLLAGTDGQVCYDTGNSIVKYTVFSKSMIPFRVSYVAFMDHSGPVLQADCPDPRGE